jgi:hypothetical protein
MRTKFRVIALAAAAVALLALAGPPAVGAITATLLATGTLADDVDINNDGIRLKTRRPTDVHVQEVRFAPGDSSGWHHHPGFAIVTVKSGTLTLYTKRCKPMPIGPGQSDVESGRFTLARNEGTVEAVVYVTFVVPHGSDRIIPASAPKRCPLV